MSEPRRLAFAVPDDGTGRRLDAWLAAQPDSPTRSQIKSAADDDRLLVDGRAARASHRLRGGEKVELLLPAPAPPTGDLVGEDIALDVLFEDECMVAIDKPAGLVVHPGAGNRSGTLVHALLHRGPGVEWPGQPGRGGIVHRLDRDTSGVILVAKTVEAHEALSRQFRERTVRKAYLALVHGRVRTAGRVELPIGRHPTERKRMSVRGRPARSAVSEYLPVESFGDRTLLEVRPWTGRTHQIRVHLAASGMPIVGDRVYGGRGRGEFPRQALHAASIEFAHPVGGGRMTVAAPLAADFAALLERLRTGRGDTDGPAEVS